VLSANQIVRVIADEICSQLTMSIVETETTRVVNFGLRVECWVSEGVQVADQYQQMDKLHSESNIQIVWKFLAENKLLSA